MPLLIAGYFSLDYSVYRVGHVLVMCWMITRTHLQRFLGAPINYAKPKHAIAQCYAPHRDSSLTLSSVVWRYRFCLTTVCCPALNNSTQTTVSRRVSNAYETRRHSLDACHVMLVRRSLSVGDGYVIAIAIDQHFLPRDASAERGDATVSCPSVCPSVTFRYRVQIGLNSSKIISRTNSLRPMCSMTPNMGDLVQREHPQN